MKVAKVILSHGGASACRDILAFVATSSPGALRIAYPTAIAFDQWEERLLPTDVLPVAFTTGLGAARTPPAERTAFLHVAVRLLP